jgi:hypothetical protein
MKIAKKLSALLLAVIMLFSMIACDGIFPNEDDSGTTAQLVLEADKTTVNPGKTVTFSSVLKDGEEVSTPDDTTYSITEGADYATISGNTLTVNENVPNNAEIKVVAKSGDVTSNTASIDKDINTTNDKTIEENETNNTTTFGHGNVGVTSNNALQIEDYEMIAKYNPYTFLCGLFENDLTLFIY